MGVRCLVGCLLQEARFNVVYEDKPVVPRPYNSASAAETQSEVRMTKPGTMAGTTHGGAGTRLRTARSGGGEGGGG